MAKVARRVAVVLVSFGVAYFAAALVARWLFGSGNILVWLIAAAAAAVGYFAILRVERVG